jgi:hypothetical protein
VIGEEVERGWGRGIGRELNTRVVFSLSYVTSAVSPNKLTLTDNTP